MDNTYARLSACIDIADTNIAIVVAISVDIVERPADGCDAGCDADAGRLGGVAGGDGGDSGAASFRTAVPSVLLGAAADRGSGVDGSASCSAGRVGVGADVCCCGDAAGVGIVLTAC
jgi:hypothetical protein